MYNSMFGAGSGPTAFAVDMQILEDIEEQEKKEKANRYGYMDDILDAEEDDD